MNMLTQKDYKLHEYEEYTHSCNLTIELVDVTQSKKGKSIFFGCAQDEVRKWKLEAINV